jgi:TolA-binding protein
MKRTERKHLKENELAHIAATVRESIESRTSQLKFGLIGVTAVLAILLAYNLYRTSVQSRAGRVLAEAMAIQEARVGAPDAPGGPSTGPSYPTERDKNEALHNKFKAVADEFPGTDAGIFARYREAGALMTLGNPKEAAAAYQLVVDEAGDKLYGQMARLGLAEAQARAGEFDKAIETLKALSTRTDGPLPIDGILFELGRIYRDAGKPTDAQQTFNRIVQEFPESQFVSDARKELDAMKKG